MPSSLLCSCPWASSQDQVLSQSLRKCEELALGLQASQLYAGSITVFLHREGKYGRGDWTAGHPSTSDLSNLEALPTGLAPSVPSPALVD